MATCPPDHEASFRATRFSADGAIVLIAPVLDWTCPAALLSAALRVVGEEISSPAPRIRRADVQPVLARWGPGQCGSSGLLHDRLRSEVTRSTEELAAALRRSRPPVVEVGSTAGTDALVKGLSGLGFHVRPRSGLPTASTIDFVGDWVGAPVRAWAEAFEVQACEVVPDTLGWAHRVVGQSSASVRHVAFALSQHVGTPQDGVAILGLAMLEACWLVRSGRGIEAWERLAKLAPEARCPPWIAAHFHGQAAAAARQARRSDEARVHLEANLELLDEAFPPGPLRDGARAGLQHDLATLLLAHPGPPDPRARQLLEDSLNAHERAGRRRGASMCRTQLADLELRLGAFDRAEELLRHALDLDERHNPAGVPVVLHQLARLYEHRGEFRTAKEEALRALAAAKRVGSPIRSIQQLENTLMRIEQHLGTAVVGNLSDALHRLEEVQIGDDRLVINRAHRLVGQFREQQSYGDAEVIARAALQRLTGGEAHDAALTLLGGVLIDQGRNDDAIALLSERAAATSDDDARRHQLGRARLAMGRLTEALEILTPLAGANNDPGVRGPAACLAAQAAFRLGEVREALALARTALDVPRLPTHLTRGARRTAFSAAIELDDAVAAREIAGSFIAIAEDSRFVEDAVEAALAKGQVLLIEGAHDAARASLDEACALTQGSRGRMSRAAVFRRVAQALYRGRLTQDAITCIDRAADYADEELEAGTLSSGAAGWVHRMRAYIYKRQEDLVQYTAAVSRARELCEQAGEADLATALDRLERADDRTMLDAADGTSGRRDPLQNARALRASGKLEEAERAALEISERPAHPANRRDAIMLAAAIRTQDNRADAALLLLAAAETRWPAFQGDPKVLALRARALQSLGRLAEAEAQGRVALDAAVRTGEWLSYVRAIQILSSLLRERAAVPEAVVLLGEAAALLRGQGWIRQAFDLDYSRARNLLSLNRTDEGLAVAHGLRDEAERLAPEDRVRLAYVDASHAWNQRDSARARQILEDAFARARVTATTTRVREARNLLETIAAEENDGGVRGEIAMGEVGTIKRLLSQSRHREAVDAAEAWVARLGDVARPDRAVALNQLATALREAKRLRDAERAARASLELHIALKMSGVPLARYSLARILLLRGKDAEARSLAATARDENVTAGNLRGVERCDRLLADAGGPGVQRAESPRTTWREALARAGAARKGGDRPAEDAAIAEAILLAEAAGDRGGEAQARGARGISAWHRRDTPEAIESLGLSYALHRELGSRGYWEVAEKLIRAHEVRGDHDLARMLLVETIAAGPPSEWQDAFRRLNQRLRPLDPRSR